MPQNTYKISWANKSSQKPSPATDNSDVLLETRRHAFSKQIHPKGVYLCRNISNELKLKTNIVHHRKVGSYICLTARNSKYSHILVENLIYWGIFNIRISLWCLQSKWRFNCKISVVTTKAVWEIDNTTFNGKEASARKLHWDSKFMLTDIKYHLTPKVEKSTMAECIYLVCSWELVPRVRILFQGSFRFSSPTTI